MKSLAARRHRRAMRLAAALSIAFSGLLLSFSVPSAGGAETSSLASPLSVSFVSSGEGWSLTTSKCGSGACVRFERTENDGKSWSELALPTPLQTWVDVYSSLSDFPLNQPDVYFANNADGWIYGANNVPGSSYPSKAELWATHDGGLTWSQIPTPPLALRYDVLTMSASNGWAYAIGWHTDDTFGLWRVAVAGNTWQRVSTPTLYAAAGGTTMEGALVFRGDGGWLMVGNDRGATGLARMTPAGQWVKWKGPCGSVGDSYAVPVASSSTDLLDVCTIGGYGGDVASGTPKKLKMSADWLFSSRDGGASFLPLRDVGDGYTTQWLGGVAGTDTATSQGLIFVEKLVRGGKSSTQRLEISRNEAKSWTTIYSVRSSVFNSYFGPVCVAPDGLDSEIFMTSFRTSSLLVSTDGGLRWVRSAV